jgi:hypothetical protein
MFNFESLEQVQVEITNRCQASCPMCLRNIHGGIENPSLVLSDWTLEEFKEIFNAEVLAQIKKIIFCGDFGDPIINNNLVAMCQYLKDNSNVSVYIYTNGSARNVEWWKSLAHALPTNHTVEFALDGLADTHSLYRIGTSYDIILRNASTFIEAGGNAHWMFIKFRHNEHQIDIARNVAHTLGFRSFNTKDSKRFGKSFPVLDNTGKISYVIDQPSNSNIKSVNFVDLKDYKNWTDDISCFTFESKELYIDAHRRMFPCCLIASFIYANYDRELYEQYGVVDNTSIIDIAKEVQLEVYSLVAEFGGFDALDTRIHSIKNIMKQPVWQELMHNKWKSYSSSPCTILCSNSSPFIKIEEQINRA